MIRLHHITSRFRVPVWSTMMTLAVMTSVSIEPFVTTGWGQSPPRGTPYRQRGTSPQRKGESQVPPAPTPMASSGAGTYALELNQIRAIDGSNSAGSAGQGAAGATLLRTAPASYPGDGSGEEILGSEDRSNPRTISNAVVAQGVPSIPNARNMTNYVWAWGQFLDHDIDLTGSSSANGTADIEIEDENDPIGPNPIPFDRSNFVTGTGTPGNPRQHANEITAFIDGSNVYGSDDARALGLRTLQGGQLKTGAGDLLPFNVDGFDNAGGPGATLLFAGDVRSNENVMLSSLHTLFVREHNRVARLLALLDPAADDELLYQTARKIVAAEIQIVTYREFLPALMGAAAPNPQQINFNPQTDPGIATEFSTALYRVGHTMLSSDLPLAENGQSTGNIALLTAFFNPSFLTNDPANVDRLLEGFAREASQEIDTFIVDDVRNFLFGPPGAGGLDLASLNIQRGRDHGLADYNTLRAAYGLPRISNFGQITNQSVVRDALEALYGSVDNIDPWVGALAENHRNGSSLGALLQAGMADQFRRLVAGDKFFYTRDNDLKQPGITAVVDLRQVRLADIVRANSTVADLPDNVFVLAPPRKSDVVAHYDAEHNRIHISGNREDNSLLVVHTPAGVLLIGRSGTRINGENMVRLSTASRPNLTVDLGQGDDSLTLMLGQFGDCLLSLGDGSNTLREVLTQVRDMISDTPL